MCSSSRYRRFYNCLRGRNQRLVVVKHMQILHQMNNLLNKAQEVFLLVELIPVEPASFVILTVCIVVATLRSQHFIAHEQHWHPLRKRPDRQRIFSLSQPQPLNGRIVGWPFRAAVPAIVFICAIPIVFTVGFVMLLVIAQQIVEGKSVVAGNTK